MGSFPSTQIREERRRSNRLSKPPASDATPGLLKPSLSCPVSKVSSPVSPNPIAWRDPWNEIPISLDSPVLGRNAQRTPSSPSVTFQSETSVGNQCIFEEEEDGQCPPSPASSLARRASFRPTTLQGSPRSRPSLMQPRRSYSVHCSSQRATTAIYESELECVTSSNVPVMGDNQRFSSIRRRSLLTRPGVATRPVTKRAQALPSHTGPDADCLSNCPTQATGTSHWPLPGCPDVVPSSKLSPHVYAGRPPTPGSDYEYTHLGQLKLGSLRVVNGSSSPCSSDRGSLDVPSSLDPSQDDLKSETEKSTTTKLQDTNVKSGLLRKRISASTLQTSSIHCDVKKQDDVPGSPFSFENSPIVVTSRKQSSFTKEAEDEGISILDDEGSLDCGSDQLEQAVREDTAGKGISHSLSKADSGYSSSASVRSFRKNSTQAEHRRSVQSAFSGSFRDFEEACNEPAIPVESSNRGSIQRQLSLQDPRSSFTPHINPRSSLESISPTSMTTMCHDMQLMQIDGRLRSTSSTVPQGSRFTVSLPQHYTQLDRSNFVVMEIPPRAYREDNPGGQGSGELSFNMNVSIGAAPIPLRSEKRSVLEDGFDSTSFRNRAGSSSSEAVSTEGYLPDITGDQAPRSKGKSPARVLSQTSGMKALPLPELPLPKNVKDIHEADIPNTVANEPRGRTKRRGIEYQQNGLRTLQK